MCFFGNRFLKKESPCDAWSSHDPASGRYFLSIVPFKMAMAEGVSGFMLLSAVAKRQPIRSGFPAYSR
jgi:hypothetical protein